MRASWVRFGVLAICFATGTAHGQDFTWDGSTNDLFFLNSNWVGNNDPSGNVNGQIIFGDEGGGNHVINSQDSNLRNITNILFTNADGAYVISGTGSFRFRDGSALLNDSAFLQTINLDLIGRNDSLVLDTLAGALTLNGSIDLSHTGGVEMIMQGGNNTIIDGVISGNNGSITMNGAGTLILSGANTFTGPLTINSGTVQLDGDLADTVVISLANVAGATLDLNGNDETIGSLTGGGATGGDVSLGAGTLTIDENGASTYGGVISGTGGLTMSGAGTLTLTNANTFTGALTINSGTVQLDGDLADAVSVSLADVAGATLDLNGNDETIGSLAGGGATGGDVTLGAGTLTIDENGASTYGGVIGGTGGVTMGGAGTLTMSGANTFTGAMTINSGTVQLDGDLADTVVISLADVAGATLDLNGNNETIGSLTGGGATGGEVSLGAGTLTIDENGAATYGGVINGTGGVTMGGTGTLTLSGANTFTGALAINSGTVRLDGDLGDNASVSLADVAGATLDLNGNDETIGSLAGGGATGGNVSLGTGTLTIDEDGASTFGGVISGTGSLTMGGAGTLTLTATNSFTGALTINSGTVRLDGDLADTVSLSLADVAGATLDLNGNDETIGSLTGGGATGGDVSLGAGTLTIDESGASTFGGVISGTGGVTMGGAGTLTLSGVNTFTGAMAINSGAVRLDGDLADTVSLSLADVAGATLDLNGNDETIGSLAGGGATGGNVTLGAGTLTIDESGASTFGGVISGTGGVTMGGTGTLTLSADNSFTGALTVNSGTLRLDGDLADVVSVSLADVAGVTLDLNGNDETIGSLAGGGATGGDVSLGAGSLTIEENGASTYGGMISGTGTVTMGGTGTLTLSGANTFTGALAIDSGTVRLDGDLADTVSVSLADVAGATLDLNGNDETIESLTGGGATGGDVTLGAGTLTFGDAFNRTYAGIISGTGGIAYHGAGTLTLSGANTFAGATTINAGALALDGSVGGDVLLNAGTRLSGVGIVGGDLTAATGSTITPGTPADSLGTLTVNGNYVQQAGSSLQLELEGTGGGSDLLDITGTATLAAGSAIDMIVTGELFISNTDQFIIIEADGGVTDNGAVITTMSATLDFELELMGGFMNGDPEYILEAVRAPDAFEVASDPGNNAIIGAALDTLVPIADADPAGEVAQLIAQLDALDAPSLNQTIGDLSPQPHEAVTSLVLNDAELFHLTQSRFLVGRRSRTEAGREPLNSLPQGAMASASTDPRLMMALFAPPEANLDDDAPFDGYFEALGAYDELDTESERTGYTAWTWGGQGGVDMPLAPDGARAGLSLAYLQTDADLNEDRGTIDVDTFRLGPYLSLTRSNWSLDASLTAGFSQLDAVRNIPSLGLEAKSDYDGFDLSVFAEARLALADADRQRLQAVVALQYTYLDFDGYRETGAGAANLSIPSRSTDSLITRLGLAYRASGEVDDVILQLAAGWEHEHFDSDDLAGAFVAGGGSFAIRTGNRETDSFYYGLSLATELAPTTTAYLNLNGDYAAGGLSVALGGGISVEF